MSLSDDTLCPNCAAFYTKEDLGGWFGSKIQFELKKSKNKAYINLKKDYPEFNDNIMSFNIG